VIKYVNILLLLVALASCKKKQVMPSLRETYFYNDANPFGSSFAHDYTQSVFADDFERSKKEFADCYDLHYGSNSVYISVTKQFYPSRRDIDAINTYVSHGNTFVVSASDFNEKFLNEFDSLKTGSNFLSFGMENTGAAVEPDTASNYNYFYYPFNSYIEYASSEPHKYLGKNNSDRNNCVVIFKGKGKLIVHNEPRLFSNYFLLTGSNYNYLNSLLGYLRGESNSVTWDTYYQRKTHQTDDDDNKNSFSTFSTFLKYPETRSAFWLGLALLILFLLSGLKRKQRIVPIIKQTENSTVAFSEAIARLYLSKKDNKLIADKTITFFNDHIRSKYLINMNYHNTGYAELLSRKADIDIDTTEKLAQLMRTIDRNSTVSNEELLQLHSLTQKFNKA
jgi:hypothetical protein